MVELSDPKGPVQEGIDNTIFIIPGIIVVSFITFFAYKLYSSLREKDRIKAEKKAAKQQRKEKRK